MKKAFFLAAAALLAAMLSFARADSIPGDLTVIDHEQMCGQVTEIVQLNDGMLVIGASEYEDNGWMANLRSDGSVRWVLAEEGNGSFRCAKGLGDGGFSALIKRNATHDYLGNQTGSDETLLAFISSEGTITQTQFLSPYTEWMIPYEDGYYLIGNSYDQTAGPHEEEAPQATLTRLDKAGKNLWSLIYSNPAYSDMTFHKGAAAADSLVIIGSGFAEDGSYVGLIHHIGPDGQVLWNMEARSYQQAFIHDVCVTSGGIISGCYAGVSFDEEMGFPESRSGFIFCMTMDGRLLWEHALEKHLSADYIVPMTNGFLVGSRGLDLENCPNLGNGWLLFLDESGNAMKTEGVPYIGGGVLELMGMAKAQENEVLLYGATLEEPGFPDTPFITRLDFLHDYQESE